MAHRTQPRFACRGRSSAPFGASRVMRGVTFIELIVAMVIVTILLTLGVSGMGQLVAENRRVAEVNNLVGALNFARAEAVARMGFIGVCPLEGSRLDGSDDPCRSAVNGRYSWQDGYVVFVQDAARTRLRVYERTGSLRIESLETQGPVIVFDPNGLARDQTGSPRNNTITFCDQRDNSNSDPRPAGVIPPRAVVISNVGRIRVAEQKDGQPINCTVPDDVSGDAGGDSGSDADPENGPDSSSGA